MFGWKTEKEWSWRVGHKGQGAGKFRRRLGGVELLEPRTLLSGLHTDTPLDTVCGVSYSHDPGSQVQIESSATLPHPTDPAKQQEHLALLNLVPHAAATHATIASGNWSDASIWAGGVVPTPGAHVIVCAGTTVTFDEVMTNAIDTLRIDGQLVFADGRDTQLKADTIVVDGGGTLRIGKADDPIDDGVAARILISGASAIDTTWDPNLLSRGLISHGTVEMYGQYVTPYVALQVDPRAGATQLVLQEQPTNWKVGDRLVLTGTQSNYAKNQDEELEIVGLAGKVVFFDADSQQAGIQGLKYNHLAPQGYGLSLYVANMNRNVVIMSENPSVNAQRGHAMFMHNDSVALHNVGFYGLGRTDKRNPANDSVLDENGQLIAGTGLNPRGRYAVHFHRAGVQDDGGAAWVTGSAVVDSPGWGYVNHESNVHMHNNVAFHVVGASFVTEFGNEIGSMVGNLSINNSGSGQGLSSREGIFDFGHGGHAFWLQGPGVEVNDNIGVGSAQGAFVFFTRSSKAGFEVSNLEDPSLAAGKTTVPVGIVPLKSVKNNVAFAASRGLETWFHQTSKNLGQSVIEGFTSWNTSGNGLFTPYTGSTTIQDAVLIGNPYKPRGTAIGRNDVTNQMTYDNVTLIGWDVGISVPINRQTVIRGGHFAAVRAIQVSRARDMLREVDIVGDPQFETLTAKQLGTRVQYDIYLDGSISTKHHDLETLFTPDIVRLGTVRLNGKQIYYNEQAADYVPFQAGLAPAFVPVELIGKTNAQLYEEYGIALAGAVAPADATPVARINGLVGSPVEYQTRLPLRSAKYTNRLEGYVLKYLDANGKRVVDPTPVNLREGWNLITRNVQGQKRTFFVFGDLEAPTFELSPRTKLVVNPNGLRFGFTVEGSILDNSFGRKSFKKTFNDLASRPILTRADGTQYILLEFTIKDLAGNTTNVALELNLDPNAPLVPGTGQRDLPPRDLPVTLDELLQQYIITA